MNHTLKRLFSVLFAALTLACAAGCTGEAPRPRLSTIAVNETGVYAIKEDGTLWKWPYEEEVNGSYVLRYEPIQVLDDVLAVMNKWVIRTDSSLWSWDYRYYHGDDGELHGMFSWEKCMDDVTCASKEWAVKTDGSLWTWGESLQRYYQTRQKYKDPVMVMEGVSYVLEWGGTVYVIKIDGSLWTQGYNHNGQIGDGTTEYRHEPVKVMDDVIAVSSYMENSFAIKSDGTLWAWGLNGPFMLLGDGTTENRLTPVKIMDDVIGVSKRMAITSDNTLWLWGCDTSGEEIVTYRAVPEKIMDDVVSVVMTVGAIVVKTDGSLWEWGGAKPVKIMDGVMVR